MGNPTPATIPTKGSALLHTFFHPPLVFKYVQNTAKVPLEHSPPPLNGEDQRKANEKARSPSIMRTSSCARQQTWETLNLTTASFLLFFLRPGYLLMARAHTHTLKRTYQDPIVERRGVCLTSLTSRHNDDVLSLVIHVFYVVFPLLLLLLQVNRVEHFCGVLRIALVRWVGAYDNTIWYRQQI